MPDTRAVLLALLDALTAGLALGYLAHQYREALVSHTGAIGVGLLLALAALAAIRAGVRQLRRANLRVGAIFEDELRDRPSPWPR